MKSQTTKVLCSWSTILLILLALPNLTFAQAEKDSLVFRHISGSATVTNNGISIVPSFSLGKPAVIFDLSIGGEKLSFEPQFRFALEGKPWSFVFWFRYKPINKEKFRLQFGAHPALMFHDLTIQDAGFAEDGLEARRFVAAEVAPTIYLSNHFRLEPYYLVGHGFDRGLINTNYLTMRGSIFDMGIGKQLLLSITPEVYYLRMDGVDGFYTASALSLKHRKLPLTFGGMVNKKINSDIDSKDFLWNLSFTYSFGWQYKGI